MVSRLRLALCLLTAAALAACGGHKPTIDLAAVESQAETTAMAPLGINYPDVVMNVDPEGTTLTVKESPEGIPWDRTTQEAVNTDGLKLWSAAWRASHPQEHGMLTLRFVSYKGPVIAQTTTKV